MNKIFKKGDNASLFNLALIISKKTASIATIKNGDVTISNGDIEIVLVFNDESKKINLVFESSCHPYWKLNIPTKVIVNTNELMFLIIFVLGSNSVNTYSKPFVSIPTDYIQYLFRNKEINLDSRFAIAAFESKTIYKIKKVADCFYLIFTKGNASPLLNSIYIVPRPRKGNEDL